MIRPRAIVFSVVASLTFAAAMIALPVSAAYAKARLHPVPAQGQKPQMASGKISSMQKAGQGALQDGFTLDVTDTQTLIFLISDDTKVTGTLKVGAKADVTFTIDDNGNKVAQTVKVS